MTYLARKGEACSGRIEMVTSEQKGSIHRFLEVSLTVIIYDNSDNDNCIGL